MSLYERFLIAQKTAEQMGHITEVYMGDYLKDTDRVEFKGVTREGFPFVLTVEVKGNMDTLL